MLRFVAKRVLGLIVILFCVITITFFLVRLMPGGPFDRERKLPEHIEKQLLAKYKLDGPLSEQYINYLGDLLHGDLRLSTKYRSRSVNEILADSLPVSGLLGGIAFCAATVGAFFWDHWPRQSSTPGSIGTPCLLHCSRYLCPPL